MWRRLTYKFSCECHFSHIISLFLKTKKQPSPRSYTRPAPPPPRVAVVRCCRWWRCPQKTRTMLRRCLHGGHQEVGLQHQHNEFTPIIPCMLSIKECFKSELPEVNVTLAMDMSYIYIHSSPPKCELVVLICLAVLVTML